MLTSHQREQRVFVDSCRCSEELHRLRSALSRAVVPSGDDRQRNAVLQSRQFCFSETLVEDSLNLFDLVVFMRGLKATCLK
jgi:hypothetical protein